MRWSGTGDLHLVRPVNVPLRAQNYFSRSKDFSEHRPWQISAASKDYRRACIMFETLVVTCKSNLSLVCGFKRIARAEEVISACSHSIQHSVHSTQVKLTLGQQILFNP